MSKAMTPEKREADAKRILAEHRRREAAARNTKRDTADARCSEYIYTNRKTWDDYTQEP